MCDYGPGISAEPISGGTGRLGRALALGSSVLALGTTSVAVPEVQGNGLWFFSSSTCTTIRFGV